MKFKIQSRQRQDKINVNNSRFFLKLFTFYFLLFTFLGCDAFVRKFTRKPKKENRPYEEIVLVPQEYKGPEMSKEELYRQYFLFWKSWHDELIESLAQKRSQKKQIDCVQEAIKHLVNLRAMLNEDRRKILDVYITQLKELQGLIAKDLYGTSINSNIQSAERLKRNILRDFSYNKISKDISYGALY